MSLELVVIAGPDSGRTFTLNRGRDLILGRSAQAQYQLNDARVSRNRCIVALEGDRFQSATELLKELTRIGRFNGVNVE